LEKSKKITIQDIARHANVSPGTVDRVLHDRGKVSPEKKQKINDTIKELNYNPNLLARTLALGKHFTVYTLFPKSFSSQDYWSLPEQGVQQAAAGYKDFGFYVESFYYSLFDETTFEEEAGKILKMNPDGVILAPLFEKESLAFIKELDKRNIPTIFIDATIPDQNNLTYIGPDTHRSGYMSGKLLHSLVGVDGDILVLNIVKGMENSTNLTGIEKGFREYYENNFCGRKPAISSLIIHSTEEEVVFREITKFYIKNPEIKGVFVTNSRAYLIARYHLYHDLNIRVTGFDLVKENIEYLKNGKIDCLISQSPLQQGIKCIKTMFDLFMYNKKPLKIQYVPLDIIIRENIDFYMNF
jgi:LacI family transcriptional regulator